MFSRKGAEAQFVFTQRRKGVVCFSRRGAKARFLFSREDVVAQRKNCASNLDKLYEISNLYKNNDETVSFLIRHIHFQVPSKTR